MTGALIGRVIVLSSVALGQLVTMGTALLAAPDPRSNLTVASASTTSPDVTIEVYFSANVLGEIEPCG